MSLLRPSSLAPVLSYESPGASPTVLPFCTWLTVISCHRKACRLLTSNKRAAVSQAQGQTAAVTTAIVQHRNTYVAAADFALLAKAGINAVRLGTGSWRTPRCGDSVDTLMLSHLLTAPGV